MDFYNILFFFLFFFFSSRRRHTRFDCDWSSDVCSSDLWPAVGHAARRHRAGPGAPLPPRDDGLPRARPQAPRALPLHPRQVEPPILAGLGRVDSRRLRRRRPPVARERAPGPRRDRPLPGAPGPRPRRGVGGLQRLPLRADGGARLLAERAAPAAAPPRRGGCGERLAPHRRLRQRRRSRRPVDAQRGDGGGAPRPRARGLSRAPRAPREPRRGPPRSALTARRVVGALLGLRQRGWYGAPGRPHLAQPVLGGAGRGARPHRSLDLRGPVDQGRAVGAPVVSERDPRAPEPLHPVARELAPPAGGLRSYPPVERWDDWEEYDPAAWPRKVTRRYALVPTICFNCEAACGLLAYVDTRTLAIQK